MISGGVGGLAVAGGAATAGGVVLAIDVRGAGEDCADEARW